MLKTYILTIVAGCVICTASIGTFIILGVYASWLVMFVRIYFGALQRELTHPDGGAIMLPPPARLRLRLDQLFT